METNNVKDTIAASVAPMGSGVTPINQGAFERYCKELEDLTSKALNAGMSPIMAQQAAQLWHDSRGIHMLGGWQTTKPQSSGLLEPSPDNFFQGLAANPLAGPMLSAELRLTNAGWTDALNNNANNYDLSDSIRDYYRRMARWYYNTNNFAKRIVELNSAFIIGRGLTWRFKQEEKKPKPGDPAADPNAPVTDPAETDIETEPETSPAEQKISQADIKKFDAFTTSPVNDCIFGYDGQVRVVSRLAVDGEAFICFIPDKPAKFNPYGELMIRNLNPADVVLIDPHPLDPDTNFWYLVEAKPTGVKKTVPTDRIGAWYLDHRFMDQIKLRGAIKGPSETAKARAAEMGFKAETPVLKEIIVLHKTVGSIGSRGNSMLTTALQWIEALKSFATARLTVVQAIAKLIFKRTTVTPDASAMARARSQMQSTVSTTSGETNPGPPLGSIFHATKTDDIEPFKFETGAASAETDQSMILGHVANSGPFPKTFFGDGAESLASATTMELPLRVMLESGQEIVDNLYTMIIWIAMKLTQSKKIERSKIIIGFPHINQRAINSFLTSLSQSVAAMPPLEDVDEFIGTIFNELAFEDPEGALAQYRAAQATRKADTDKKAKDALDAAKKGNPNDPNAPNNPNGPRPDEGGKLGNRTGNDTYPHQNKGETNPVA